MRKLKVIQLASFEGNIGDNANMVGTRTQLSKNLNFEIEYFDIEIREFFWKIRKYDDQFIDLVNQHDLLIIGGGNYFELWVEHSNTGTSIDISFDVLRRIKVPILFYALGVDPAMGFSNNTLNRFKSFLDCLFSSKKYLVSVRNDGSMDTVRTYFGEDYARKMYHVPDGGFFTVVKDHFHPELPNNENNIGINLAGDMLDIRFGNSSTNSKKINSEVFTTIFGDLINKFLEENSTSSFVFIPHIFKDLNLISHVISKLEDKFIRNRITVAPYIHGTGSQEYIFDLYRKCDLIIGNRFHANACAIGLCVPSIGIINYAQIGNLYKELNMIDRSVVVNELGFEKILRKLILDSLLNAKNIKQKYAIVKDNLLKEIKSFHNILNKWIDANY